MMADVAKAWDNLLAKAKADGVENVIVQGYYKSCASAESAGMDKWRGDTKVQLINTGKRLGLKLVYIDPRDDSWFASKRPAQYTKADCIHPTNPASERLAQLVWNAMTQNNIEQGAGCTAGSGGTTGGCN